MTWARCLLLAALAVPASATTLGETTLGSLVGGSYRIVIGKVARVVDVAGLRVAEVDVVQSLKGEPPPTRLWYLADGASGVDISHAVVGETALLFLRTPKGARDGAADPAFAKGVKELTGGAPLLQLCWAGYGRMPLRTVEGVRCARVYVDFLHLPMGMATLPGSDPRSTHFDRYVPLAGLVRRIEGGLRPWGEMPAPLLRLLRDLDRNTGVSPSDDANELLELLGDTPVPALLALLDDPAFPRRETVAEALIWISPNRLEPLVEGLRAEDPVRRRAAAFALAFGIDSGIVGADDHVVEALLPLAADPDAGVRAHAAWALALTGHDECVAAAIAAFADGSDLVRRSALRVFIRGRAGMSVFVHIEEFEPERAEAALLRLTAADDLGVRREGWEVLMHAAGPASLPAVRKALDDPDRVVRACAVRALARCGAAEHLVPLLASKDVWVRRCAAHALGAGKMRDGVLPLANALRDPDGAVVRIAIEALGEIGPEAIAAVPALEHLGAHSDHDEAVGEAIARITPFRVLRYQAFEGAARDVGGDAEALIDELVKIRLTRDGITNDAGGGIHFSRTDDAFGRLVRMGPAALPAVLAHLDDARPTQLAFPKPESGAGGMFLSRELMAPHGRAVEARRIRDAFGDGVMTDWFEFSEGLDLDRPLPGHTVTVGDCCFAILGEIVNRPYEAVRYQPSAITAVCSPIVEPRVAKAVRAAWGHGDPWRLLAHSLQQDFHTRGPGSGALQVGAAERLCLYFPEHGGAMVARRVAGLTFDTERDGLRATPLLRAVLRTNHPAVRAAWMAFLDPARPAKLVRAAVRAIPEAPDPDTLRKMRAVFEKHEDVRVVLECVAAFPRGTKELFPRLEKVFRRVEPQGRFRTCQKLIDAMVRSDPERARAVCLDYVRGGPPQAMTVLGSLYWARNRELAVAVAAPLLADRAPLPRGPPRIGGYMSIDRRICDLAATVLSRADESLAFENDARVEDRDRAIAVLREALAD